jgi:hypothetical protein
MEYIDVRGLPETVARAVQAMVDALRNRGAPRAVAPQTPVDGGDTELRLDHRRGAVIGRLTREELYDDVA